MANARAIVKRLKAVKNVRKITRTMELIATARFKKAMDRATEAAAYTRKLAEIVADLARANPSVTDLESLHPLLKVREEQQNCALLILTSNRGLCGGYNGSVLRLAMQRIREARAVGQNLRLQVAGKRGVNFLKFLGIEVDEKYLGFEDQPGYDEVDAIAARFAEQYVAGTLDRVDVAYTRFVSVSRQTAVLETLLPLGDLATEARAAAKTARGPEIAYEFLPSAREILEEIVPASFKARVFKCFLDAAVSEQIARMVAMKGATENADDMIRDFSQQYNRARQTQITSELAEIIGGAAALE
jgi:F-type H+-transporting ATPase subunit gamma